MSRDDEIDYRIMYPVEGRKRKRRSANPKPSAKPDKRPTFGFFTEDRVIKARTSDRADEGKSYGEARPRKSMLRATKELLCDYPEIGVQQLMEKLERLGYEAAPVTITSIRRDFLDTIKVAREMGYVKVLD
ncbi:MAG TPA: hypothetical protein VMT08_27035 [Bradyrhizobium sp.]|nr:hypothetical protein [Bradyrhizobium sp.]